MQFKSINHFIRHYQLDMNHWINAEVARYLNRKVYEKKKVLLHHVPVELDNYEIECINSHSFKPDWLKKRYPTSVFYGKEIGLIQETQCNVKCPSCGGNAIFKIPVKACTRNIDIFGDEAKRIVNGKTVFVYSFISFSGSSDRKLEFEKRFLEIKSSFTSVAPPESWVLHMTELLSGNKRKESELFSTLDRKDVLLNLNKLLELIKEFNESYEINLYSAVGIYLGETLKKHEEVTAKEAVYTSCLMRVIKETTDHGIAPKFYFERTGSDGWAKTLFDGGRMTLVWPWVTNGIPVMSPKFVEPEFSLYLEIADIVSYILGRYLFCLGKRVEGQDSHPDINPCKLGLVRYVLTDASGAWRHDNSIGFPDNTMFRGTQWEKFI